MKSTLAFDVYGTLINPSGVYHLLHDMFGSAAEPFMNTWRSKQLEYSFRRGLMDMHADFSVVTRQALDYCSLIHQIELSTAQRNSLMKQYERLPPFEDAVDTVLACREAGFRVFAFSNGSREALRTLLGRTGMMELMDGVVSAADVQMFKPSPVVYQHFLKSAASEADHTWLISGNTFDVVGALACGMRGAWINRGGNGVFDPWDMQPDLILNSLAELPGKLRENLT